MAKPIHQDLGYIIAALIIGGYLLIALLSAGLRPPRRIATAYIGVGLIMVSYALVSAIQSKPLELVGLLAGLLSLFWGAWYLSIAFTFLPTSPQAVGLCALAAANSSLGVILGTRTEVSKLSTVTVCGCYTILLGIQIYLTAAMLHRELMREKVPDRP